MPQISSQATRQAILVDDSTFDPQNPPDKLALFGEDGTLLDQTSLRGNDGAQGPPGIPGITWRGDYNALADYVINDTVFHEGSSWRAIIPMMHPAPEPSDTGALETNPVYSDSGDWPPMAIGVPVTVVIPDDQTAQWRYFDLLTGGDVTFSWDSDASLFTAPYTTDGTNYGPGGANPPNPFTVTLPAGRIWVDFQDSNVRPTPNTVNMTVTLSNGATVSPSLPWALVAKKGVDGAWVVAQDDTQVAIPTDGSAIGPELDFKVGDSGLVLLHGSFTASNGSDTSRLGVSIDGAGSLAEATINSGVAQFFSLGFSDDVVDLVSSNGVAVRPGAMLRLAPGAHTARFVAGASNAGGQASEFRLAAQAL